MQVNLCWLAHQLKTEGFRSSKVLLFTCPCSRQLLHWDYEEDAWSKNWRWWNDIHLHPITRVVVSVSTSRSRDGLETYQRLVSVSTKIVNVSVSSRPLTSRAQDQFSAKFCRSQ